MVLVCIPTLNEAETIGEICQTIKDELMVPENKLVSHLLVVDGGSEDETPAVALENGAQVIGPPQKLGKGAALYEGLLAATKLSPKPEIIVFCDGDLSSFTSECITKLATPLLEDASVMMVKGFYEKRRLGDKDSGGGRTTWLMARPLLSLFFPALAHLREPLSGEYAMRMSAAECLPFVTHYGVELALMVDLAKAFGADSIAEANLGNRTHKNRTLEDLSIQASQILHTALYKAEVDFRVEWSNTLVRPGFENSEIVVEELPPINPESHS